MVTLKTKMAVSFLSARSLPLIAKTNLPQGNVRTKDIWSGKAQRSLKRKLLVSRPTPAPLVDQSSGGAIFVIGIMRFTMERAVGALNCQSALDRDPRSASKRDPLVLRFERLALAPLELAGIAETGRARGDV